MFQGRTLESNLRICIICHISPVHYRIYYGELLFTFWYVDICWFLGCWFIFYVTDASSVASVVDAIFIKPCEIEDKKWGWPNTAFAVPVWENARTWQNSSSALSKRRNSKRATGRHLERHQIKTTAKHHLGMELLFLFLLMPSKPKKVGLGEWQGLR